MMEPYYIFIAILILGCIMMMRGSAQQKEGFVKYYQQDAQGGPDYLGNIDDGPNAPNNSGVTRTENFVTNARKNLERALRETSLAASETIKKVNRMTANMESHKGVIDVVAVADIIRDRLLSEVNKHAQKFGSAYDMVNPKDVLVRDWPNGVRQIEVTIEAHDVSPDLWSPYTTNVRMTFYDWSGVVALTKVNIFEEDKDNKGPSGFADDTVQEQFVNKTHLAYPWHTNEQSSGLYMSEAERKKILSEKRAKASEDNFYCFGVAGLAPSDTKNLTREECTRRGGVVDAPVVDAVKCQFFKANKNYPNNRGGSKFGYCEGPLGMVNTSFSRWDPNPAYAPLCYNCKGSVSISGKDGDIGPCCEDQKANLTEYNLLTPDYAFPGDMIDRRKFETEFKKRGLSWYRLQ